MDRWMVLGIALFVSSGCSSYAVARYGVSVENVTTLRTLAGQKVSVGAFGAAKAGQTEIMCRAVGPIRTPDGKPFEDFIRSALVDELKVAEVLSEGAARTLTAQAFTPAVQSLIGKLVRNPEFRGLLE